MNGHSNLLKVFILGFGLTAFYGSFAQPDTTEIFELEYFFDVDPGFGNATNVVVSPPDTSVSLVETLSASGLATGFHVLGVRAKNVPSDLAFFTGSVTINPNDYIDPILNSSGQWGMTETRLVFVDESDGAAFVNVDQIEYFFDVDPGVGSATLVNSFSANNIVSIEETFFANGLATGFHVLGVRARAEGGAWGTIETRLIFVDESDGAAISKIDSLEYFFDVDPGVGSATLIDSFSANSFVSLVESLNASSLSTGFHVLGLRAKAEGGTWGIMETRLVFVDPSNAGSIVNVDEIEYFIDIDPGVGNGVPIGVFSPTNNISIVDSVDASGLSLGFHVLGMRARAEGGSWGLPETRLIYVDQNGSVSQVVEFEYFIDVDPGLGLANNISITPGHAVTKTITLQTDTLSIGIHSVHVRAKNEIDWGIAESVSLLVVDVGPPIISSSQTFPTNAGTIDLSVVFEEAVNSFIETDIVVSEGGTIQPSSFTVLNDSTYGLLLDLSAEGLISVDIADSAGFTLDTSTPTPAAIAFEILYDITAPSISVNALTTNENSPALSGTIDDSTAIVSITIQGVTYPTVNIGGSWQLNAGVITPMPDGTYEIMAMAVDLAGNIGNDTTTNELIVSGSVFQAFPATTITSTSFNANWSLGIDVLNYELDVSTLPDFSSLLPGFDSLVTTANTMNISNLDFATSYYYRVRIRDISNQLLSNSNIRGVKTTIDSLTIADSLALIQVYNALSGLDWSPPSNWDQARLREWDGITLNASKTRVDQVDISSRGAVGSMPISFDSEAAPGLRAISLMNLSNNQIEGLMDFNGISITNLDVSNNALTFDDLEPLVAINTFIYAPQSDVRFNEDTGTTIKIPALTDITLSASVGGSANAYVFSRNGATITQGAEFNVNESSFDVLSIDYDNMGRFAGEITNSLLPDLTLQVSPVDVLAVADLAMIITNADNSPLSDPVSGFLLETIRRAQGFDTLAQVLQASSSFSFTNVVLGDYLCGIEPSNKSLFVGTYFGDEFEWTLADTLFFRGNAAAQIRMTEVPQTLTSANGEGKLDVIVEEDFGDEGARIDARRRAAKRKCGLRKRRRGGRTGEDDVFDLIAYGETDDNGEFKFGFLPEGVYRFFVEYPGIPLDESATVEFEVGEAGISDTDFKLEAFVTEEGIQVTIDRVLGLIFDYFKDLQVYPNPAIESIKISYRHLRSTNIKAQLVDLMGNILWHENMQYGFNGQQEIDVSSLSEGIYLLHVFDAKDRKGTVVTYRIIINE